ncbi:MAG TPA: phosphatidylserine decarboxylase [Bryobacteraceae bacterium]|nr:phosphatidylserine decarboxylase [Bryobacteraceae bacterium]
MIDGILYALGSVAAGVFTAWLTGISLTAVPFFVFAVFCLYFFRDPEREAPQGPYCVSPADGKVMAVKPAGSDLTRVTIFLNVFDVHVNRSPVAGVIQDITYKRGDFLVASKEVASDLNEQNVVVVQQPDGVRVIFKQIAGLIARRIVFRKKVGDPLIAGERIGLMKFGSRMDVLLGPEWKILVAPGQRVAAATTILAERVSQT